MVLPVGTNLMGVARHAPCNGFLSWLAHWALSLKRAKARGNMAEGLRPRPVTDTQSCHRPPAPPNAG
jgi:hypothetical protein